jgi:SsrA-binding protein
VPAKSKSKATDGLKIIAKNRKARHDYEILETFEAGLVLQGSEVKSARDGRVSLTDAYATIDERGEAWLVNAHIAEYPFANQFNHAPRRRRKLLLHERELARLTVKIRERGLTLAVLAVYFKKGLIKAEIGLARGRKSYDKREAIKKKDEARAKQVAGKERD